MPAPDRIGNVQTFSNVINPTKGIVGYYSDAEVDALLAALPTGGGLQTVDLSAYATTAYVDGQIATLYSKAEVDAAITAAIAGVVTGGTVDLNGYATEQFVTDAIAAIPPANLDDYYTKPATDAAIKAAAEQSALDLDAVQSQLVFAIEETGKQTQEKIDLKADKATTYTKAEVDEALANVATGGAVDLSNYATTDQLDATKTEILTAATTAFQERYTKQEVDGLFVSKADMVAPPSLDGYATEQYVDDTIARIPATDLSAYAKLQDNQQPLLAKTVVSQAYGFGDTLLPPVALGYTDTGEGYGARLVLNVGVDNEFLVYKSDLEPLNALLPRIETLEGKQAPAEMDMSSFAKLADANQTIVASAVEASRFRFDATRSVVMLQSGGKERPVYRDGAQNNALAFVSELAGLCTIEDAATRIADCAKKATTYTKTEADGKFLTLVDVNGVYAFAAETYKKTETYTKAEVETRLLEVPSPMKYLQWGGAFQKMPAGSAKDKWFAAGLLPSIQIVKGKHYRLEMTTKFGPLNADYKECWVGFRFNYKALNELPCTKQPLVTMGGFGHTTVTRARAAIAATAVATTTPTRADRFRFLAVDDWASAEDIIDYAVEFEADQDIASANFVPEICFGGTWGQYPTNFEGVVAVFRQMD